MYLLGNGVVSVTRYLGYALALIAAVHFALGNNVAGLLCGITAPMLIRGWWRWER